MASIEMKKAIHHTYLCVLFVTFLFIVKKLLKLNTKGFQVTSNKMTRREMILYGTLIVLQMLLLLLRIYVLFREKWLQQKRDPIPRDEL